MSSMMVMVMRMRMGMGEGLKDSPTSVNVIAVSCGSIGGLVSAVGRAWLGGWLPRRYWLNGEIRLEAGDGFVLKPNIVPTITARTDRTILRTLPVRSTPYFPHNTPYTS